MHPARRYFRRSTYLQSTVWIAARLAEALEHAHNRGLLHRDIKPSNILLAADGTPMLLDFNLSAEVRRDGDAGQTAAEVGGTLPYMAPEHLDAFDPDGTTPPEKVDERSDLYSLGLILFEMVTGRHPFPTPPPDWPLRDAIRALIADRLEKAPSARVNESIPWSLDSILRKCLDPDPARRYQSACDLAEDLRRFLDDQPLAFAPETSLSERAAKWARRHPRACNAGGIGGLAAFLLVAVAVSAALAAGLNEPVRLPLGRIPEARPQRRAAHQHRVGPDPAPGRRHRRRPARPSRSTGSTRPANGRPATNSAAWAPPTGRHFAARSPS
ncbi:MAG: serine/threonine-protein kinase [Isosphaeraceae bacterium]